MVSIAKRVAGIGAAVAVLGVAGPVAVAGAATQPAVAPAPVSINAGLTGPFQAGLVAAVGGLNAGADGAVAGWNAGAAALGLPFQFTVNTWGPLGLHVAGVAPVAGQAGIAIP